MHRMIDDHLQHMSNPHFRQKLRGALSVTGCVSYVDRMRLSSMLRLHHNIRGNPRYIAALSFCAMQDFFCDGRRNSYRHQSSCFESGIPQVKRISRTDQSVQLRIHPETTVADVSLSRHLRHCLSRQRSKGLINAKKTAVADAMRIQVSFRQIRPEIREANEGILQKTMRVLKGSVDQ